MGLFKKQEDDEILEYQDSTPQELQDQNPELEEIDGQQNEIVNTYLDEMGIIAETTVVHGSVKTKGHLAVAGIVEGNVICDGNLMVTGDVRGCIECNNLVVENTSLTFKNLKVKGSVSLKESSNVSGNISCKHISILGTYTGNIKAQGNVGINKNAVIKGDISAAVLAIEPGAKIKGMIDVK